MISNILFLVRRKAILIILLIIMLFPQFAYCSPAKGTIRDLSGKIGYYTVRARSNIDFLLNGSTEKNISLPKKVDVKNEFPPKSVYQNILAVIKLPETVPSGSCIALRTFSSDFVVYCGGEKIYTFSGRSNGSGQSMGYAYHMIHLSKNLDNASLIIRFQSVFSQYGKLITDLRLGNDEEISSHISRTIINVTRSETYYIILGGAFAFIGFLLILFFMSKQENEFAFVYLGLSSILMGVWILFENNIITVYVENKYFTFVVGAIALQLMALGFLGFVDELFTDKRSMFSKWLKRVIIANAILTFLFDISDTLSLYLSIRIFHVLLVITIGYIIRTVKKASSHGSLEAKLYLVGFGLLSMCGVIDVLNMYYIHFPFSPNIHISAWAMLTFILLLIIILYWHVENINLQIRRYNKEIRNKNSELQEAWEEIKQSRDAVTELNANLEKKVHNRTKQLEDANEELTAINEELNETMSALKKAQVQLIQSEKMASLGNLVAGVAHEINTPLATIKSNIQMEALLLEAIDSSDSANVEEFRNSTGSMHRVSKDALERIIEIVKNLRTFARLDEAEVKEADIHQGLDNTLSLVKNQISGKLDLIKDYGDLPMILCYPGQLNQVFLNIIVNAIHAMEGMDRRGVLKIQTEHRDGKVIIIFTDNGHGISEKNIPKIFDPGFTTKGVGIGTGLGLSISYNIIQKHNGTISVESKENIGTKFTIELPVKMD